MFQADESNLETILSDLRIFLDEEELGRRVTIQIAEMAKEKFGELKEFQGF